MQRHSHIRPQMEIFPTLASGPEIVNNLDSMMESKNAHIQAITASREHTYRSAYVIPDLFTPFSPLSRLGCFSLFGLGSFGGLGSLALRSTLSSGSRCFFCFFFLKTCQSYESQTHNQRESRPVARQAINLLSETRGKVSPVQHPVTPTDGPTSGNLLPVSFS
jgi:hypothetical protein